MKIDFHAPIFRLEPKVGLVKSVSIPYHTNPSPSGIFIRRIEAGTPPEGRNESHRDNYYIFALLTAGSALGMVDFREVPVATHQAIIVAPGQVHAMQSYDSCTMGWMMALSQEMFSATEVDKLFEYALCPTPFDVDIEMMSQLSNLLELSQLYADVPAVVHHSASIVKALLLRHLPSLPVDIPHRYLKLTVAFKRLLAEHIAVEKSPSAYASMLNISEVYLNEAVKNVTGLSASGCIRSQVIIEAKRMLTYTNLTPSEIAVELGYTDYSYFSRLFKKETAQSPIEFRKNLK